MISIFTPTYNREKLIIKLAESLVIQTNKNFEWIIIDDGSSDNTENVIKEYIDILNIRYYKQKNQGKHVAYNRAIELCGGDKFVCVDSDDVLLPTAVELYEKCDCDNVIGFVFPQSLYGCNDDDKWKRINSEFINITDLKFRYGIGESNILIKTKYLKKYRFPIFADKRGKVEKFCPEDVLYNMLISDGLFKVVNSSVYVSQYQEGGLTSKVFKLWLENPCSTLLMLKSRYKAFEDYKIFSRIMCRTKCILNINALCFKIRCSILKNTPSKLYSILLYIPSVLFCFKRFK